MRLLLDTQIALWFLLDDPRLPRAADALIREAGNDIFFSIVSLWEAAIKRGLERPQRDPVLLTPEQFLIYGRETGFVLLPLDALHVLGLRTLPGLHGDPFDRMLVAQAKVEELRLLTTDTKLRGYGDVVLPA